MGDSLPVVNTAEGVKSINSVQTITSKNYPFVFNEVTILYEPKVIASMQPAKPNTAA